MCYTHFYDDHLNEKISGAPMLKCLKNLFFLLVPVLNLSFVPPAAAQTWKAIDGAKDAAMYAREYIKNDALASALEKDKNAKKIFCGNQNTLCNAVTEICLKCKVSSLSVNGGIGVSEYGRCVPKQGFNSLDLHANWPASDSRCPAKSRNILGNITDAGIISIEPTGFIDSSEFTQGFYTFKSSQTFSGADGNQYRLIASDKPTLVYANETDNNSTKGCEVLPVKYYNMKGCFFCPLARLIFSAANEVTRKTDETFSASFLAVVVVLFALWLALTALQQVFPLTKQDAPKFLSAILKQGFKVALVFFLLMNINDLFRFFINPVLMGGLDMGIAILDKEASLSPIDCTMVPESCCCNPVDESYYNLPVGGKNLFCQIETYLSTLQKKIAYMQAIGTSLFCVGSHEIITIDTSQMKEGIRMMFLGGFLTVFGFLLTISFAFYFLDAVLQLAILGAMLPFMIAGWPFKATAQYATTGFKMLLNTFFVMFFTGFVVSACLILVGEALSIGASDSVNQEQTNSAAVSKMHVIAEAINNQNIAEIRKETDISGSGFLLLLFACIFGFKFIAQASPLAASLSSGGFKKPLASRIGTMAASATKGMALKASAPVREAVSEKYHQAGGLVGIVGHTAAEAGKLGSAAGSGLKTVGQRMSAAGEKMASSGSLAGKIAGATIKASGAAAKAAGTVTKAAGTAVKATGGGVEKIAKNVHRAAFKKGKH